MTFSGVKIACLHGPRVTRALPKISLIRGKPNLSTCPAPEALVAAVRAAEFRQRGAGRGRSRGGVRREGVPQGGGGALGARVLPFRRVGEQRQEQEEMLPGPEKQAAIQCIEDREPICRELATSGPWGSCTDPLADETWGEQFDPGYRVLESKAPERAITQVHAPVA